MICPAIRLSKVSMNLAGQQSENGEPLSTRIIYSGIHVWIPWSHSVGLQLLMTCSVWSLDTLVCPARWMFRAHL
jgi:hypothetical protein